MKSLIDNVEKGKIDKKVINVNYILEKNKYGYNSLHGEKEIDEDLRQIYVRDKLGIDKYLKYMKTFIYSNGNYIKALKSIGLTDKKIFSNTKFISNALYFESIKTEKNNINASPSYTDGYGKKLNIAGF